MKFIVYPHQHQLKAKALVIVAYALRDIHTMIIWWRQVYMKRIRDYSSDSVLLEKPNTRVEENIKVIGSSGGISMIEGIIEELELNGDLEIVSRSLLLNNKGENRKRKFYTVNLKTEDKSMKIAKSADICRVISICNQKGGVTKSATTVQLAAALTRLGYKVLVIDADAQATLTKNLGFKNERKPEITLSTIFEKFINDEEVESDYGILQHDEGFDLVPSDIHLAGIELSLINVMNRERILRDYVIMEHFSYDFILIDCMPSLGMITINALAASDSVIIPVEADLTSADGLQELIKTIFKVRKQINPDLFIEGILLTKVDLRTNYAKEMKELISGTYGRDIKIFSDYIPISVKVAECAAYGTSIYVHSPKCSAAEAYMSLAQEVLG